MAAPPPLPTDSSSIRWQPELDTDEYLEWNMGVGRLVKATLTTAMDGDLTALENLIRTDPTLVHCNVGYREPLYFAVGNNHLDCVRLLVDNGAEVTYRSGDRTHQRPIERALDRGFDAIATVLKAAVEEQCDCLYIDDGEILAEHIRLRDLDTVTAHLDRHPNHIRACDERGNAPIHWAVLTMNMRMVRALLDRGADVNAIRSDGARPIDLVFGDYFFRRRDVPPDALSDNKVMLGYLLAHGAAYDLRTAASVGDTEEVRRQIAADPRALHRLPDYFTWYTGTALCNATMSGHSDIVRLLLEAGGDPSQPEPGLAPRGSALIAAASRGDEELVRLLLAHGADPNGGVESSGNPCGRAANETIRQLLLEAGGRFEEYDNLKGVPTALLEEMFGDVPVRYFVDNRDATGLRRRLENSPERALEAFEHALGDREIMGICLDADSALFEKAAPDLVVNLAGTPGFEDEADRMAKAVDLNQPDWLGRTVLHRVASGEWSTSTASSLEIAQLLVRHGARLDISDQEYSSTPIGWAARTGQSEMVEYLLGEGAPLDAPFEWVTPLAWARRRNHHDIIRILEGAR